jgi:uncharacterized protein YndB with AHSA1/START domain
MSARNKHVMALTLPSDREVLLTRSFDAPRTLVFDACTQPEHLRNWWGIDSMSMVVCEIDLRVGGKRRVVLRGPDGSEHGFGGVFREVVRPERYAHTEVYDPFPQHESLVTATFVEHAGVTTMTSHSLYGSTEARDGHLSSGLEAGARVTFDRLEELVRSLT